mmetsp:Transcript_23026/g.23246  ORF Transcript_23026/g.23246 Transcript_23026/m.23246 type:complete len:205 (+) Transcript_23026:231-845(+)
MNIINSTQSYFTNLTSIFTGAARRNEVEYHDTPLTNEQIEEYRMLSGFEVGEILRLRKVFLYHTNHTEDMSKEVFLNLPAIIHNPLNDRICAIFGYDNKAIIDFRAFIIGISSFNSPGNKEHKLRVAFRLHDFDEDNYISQEDLRLYLLRITGNKLSSDDINKLIQNVFDECSGTDKQTELISFLEFQRIMASTDFQTKLLLPM